MNRKFVVLSDKVIAVIDDSGNISKRTFDNGCQEVLLSENKIELVNNKLENFKRNLSNQEGVVFLSKKMLASQPIILLLISAGAFVYGGITSSGNFLTHALNIGCQGFICASIISGSTAIYYGVVNQIYKKKINKTKSEIIIAKKLKEEYEKELTNIKEKQLTNKSPTIAINVDKLVSLVEQTNDMELQIDEDINKNYTQLVLRRSKKWNI